MKKIKKTPLSFAIGTSIVASFASTNVMATNNPFAMTELSSGYMNLAEAEADGDKKMEGKCGEGKCGGKAKDTEKKAEGKCGEGKCGGKAKDTEKKVEGKCGEGKCGGKAKDSEK